MSYGQRCPVPNLLRFFDVANLPRHVFTLRDSEGYEIQSMSVQGGVYNTINVTATGYQINVNDDGTGNPALTPKELRIVAVNSRMKVVPGGITPNHYYRPFVSNVMESLGQVATLVVFPLEYGECVFHDCQYAFTEQNIRKQRTTDGGIAPLLLTLTMSFRMMSPRDARGRLFPIDAESSGTVSCS